MSTATCQVNCDNNIIVNTECKRIDYDLCRASKEKDMIISQLKAKIFELELHQKDYNALNQRFNQLQNEFAGLNVCKQQLECERNQRDSEFSKHLNALQCDNENLQIGFNEKLSGNKNLYSQNNILGKQIEIKDCEIRNLRANLNDLQNQLNKNSNDKNNLQNIINGLNDIKNNQSFKISQLLEDNKTLKQLCQEQDQNIKLGNQERENMAHELEDKNNNIKELNCQIRVQINNINNLQNQINQCENVNMQYKNKIKDCERQVDCLRGDNNNLKNNLISENSIRSGENQKNNQLNNILNDREIKINQICHDIENIKIMQQNATNTSKILQDENTKMRNHIMILTSQNQTLMNEIDNVLSEDERMHTILNRQDRISSLLMNNRSTIDQSLNNLDECINRGKCFVCRSTCSCSTTC